MYNKKKQKIAIYLKFYTIGYKKPRYYGILYFKDYILKYKKVELDFHVV